MWALYAMDRRFWHEKSIVTSVKHVIYFADLWKSCSRGSKINFSETQNHNFGMKMFMLMPNLFVSMQCVTHIKTITIVLHESCADITVTLRHKCFLLGTVSLDQQECRKSILQSKKCSYKIVGSCRSRCVDQWKLRKIAIRQYYWLIIITGSLGTMKL